MKTCIEFNLHRALSSGMLLYYLWWIFGFNTWQL